MPKYFWPRRTRRDVARDLLSRLERGPAIFADDGVFSPIPRDKRKEVRESYANWLRTWILSDLRIAGGQRCQH